MSAERKPASITRTLDEGASITVDGLQIDVRKVSGRKVKLTFQSRPPCVRHLPPAATVDKFSTSG